MATCGQEAGDCPSLFTLVDAFCTEKKTFTIPQ